MNKKFKIWMAHLRVKTGILTFRNFFLASTHNVIFFVLFFLVHSINLHIFSWVTIVLSHVIACNVEVHKSFDTETCPKNKITTK